MNREDYLQELRKRLQFRAVPRQRTDELVAEVASHLAESGEEPLEAFGSPDRYAARLVRGRWHTSRFVIGMISGISGGLLLGGIASALGSSETTVDIQGENLLFGATIALGAGAALLPAVHRRLPSTGARLLLAAALVGSATIVTAVVVPSTGLDGQVLLTLTLASAAATSLGLLAITAATMAGPYLLRRIRRLRA